MVLLTLVDDECGNEKIDLSCPRVDGVDELNEGVALLNVELMFDVKEGEVFSVEEKVGVPGSMHEELLS